MRKQRKRILALVLAMLMVVSCLSGCSSIFTSDKADEPDDVETALISLANTDHGSVYFSGSTDTSMNVEIGSSVTLVVAPDAGYKADAVSFIDKDGEAADLEVTDNLITLDVTKSGTVSATFSEVVEVLGGGSLQLEIEEGDPVISSVEAYILENADPALAGSNTSLEAVDVMDVTHTFVDGSLLPNATLDELWSVDEDGDGYSDNVDAYINQLNDTIALYNISDSADYLVGKVSREMTGGVVTDYTTAFNNISGVVLDDLIYDDDTKLVYVPKSYHYYNEAFIEYYEDDAKAGDEIYYQTQIQLVYTVDDIFAASLDVDVIINSNDAEGVDSVSGTGHVSFVNPYTVLTIADEDSLDDVRLNMIDSVVVNDTVYENGSDMWSYDESNGRLTIYMSPAVVDVVEINVSDSLVKSIGGFFSSIFSDVTAKADAPDIGGTFTFDSTPTVTSAFRWPANGIYHHDASGANRPEAGSIKGASIGLFGATETIDAITGSGSVSSSSIVTSKISPWPWCVTLSGGRYDLNGLGVSYTGSDRLCLFCAHTNLEGSVHSTCDFVTFRIIAVEGNTIYIGIAAPTAGKQAGGGIYKATFNVELLDPENPPPPPTIIRQEKFGQVRVHKVSEHPEYTDGNNGYSYEGTTYGVYCNNQLVSVLTVGADGWSGYSDRLDADNVTYTVKEISSSLGYLVNSESKSFTLSSDGQKVDLTMDGGCKEETVNDPVAIVVQKKLSYYNDSEGFYNPGEATGNIPDLAGIKFRLDYYANVYGSGAEAKANGTVNASAIFATNAKGFLQFEYETAVDGTIWPYREDGQNVFPIGTYILTEVSALDGFYIDTRYSNGNVACAWTVTDAWDTNGHVQHESVLTTLDTWPSRVTSPYAEVGIVENTGTIWHGGVTVYKADNASHSMLPQGDGSLAGITYEITNKSLHSVVVEGVKYEPGEVVKTITSVAAVVPGYNADKTDGGEIFKSMTHIATTGDRVLPYGTYEIKEVSANESYINAGWSQTFTISSDGQMVMYDSVEHNWNENPVQRGGIWVVKGDFDTDRSEPQGDATLAGAVYAIYNRSKYPVYVDGNLMDGFAWFPTDSLIMTITTEYDASIDKYIARTYESALPYGTYEVIEITPPKGYQLANYRETVEIRYQGDIQKLYDSSSRYNTDEVYRGGVMVMKADADWKTSNPQGDATLDGVEYTITNRSEHSVYVKLGNQAGREFAPGAVITTITTTWNEPMKAHIAATASDLLPYGTYEITETKASTGYLNAGWTQTFSIRRDGQVVEYTAESTNWNENAVKRGSILVGKVDRELGQYISLGEADLAGATFEIINRSNEPVYVNGVTYKVGEVCMTIATQKMTWNGETIYAAYTGDLALPYGTYEVREVASGTGYLYDSTSRAFTQTVQIREHEQLIDLTNEGSHEVNTDYGVVANNQVLREDFHFQKKDSSTQDVMANVAFLITSMTTGEQHIIVTDENGTWGSASTKYETSDATQSAYRDHTKNTNANDPTSPISNGAAAIDEDGNWYIKDSSKLDSEAGTWFAGLSDDLITWKADSAGTVYYEVNDGTYLPNDALRAFPYDTYYVQELECDANEDHKLISFTVTLHRYTEDHDGLGLNIDYGTLFDDFISVETILTFDGTDKIVPNGPDVDITDQVLYGGLESGKYTIVGELWLLNEDGTDVERMVATKTETFAVAGAIGSRDVVFTLDTTELGGRTLVAYEYIYKDDKLYGRHADINDADQRVKVLDIHTTLNGDLDHMDYGTTDTVVLTDTITYNGLEVGKTYTINGTLMDKATGLAVRDTYDNPITSTVKFTAPKTSGTVDITFTFSGVNLAGHTVVAFETISRNGTEYAVHEDLNDEDQTVYYPDVDTFAVDGADGNKDLAEAKDQTIVDAVKVTNLLDGYTYRLDGELHVRNAEGEDEGIIGTAQITWDGNSSDHTMTFEGIDASALGGKDIVVFQNLYGRKNSESAWALLGSHTDISDDDQAVRVPHIGTVMLTSQGIHEIQVPEDGMVTLTDTVSYENLTPGHEYVVYGVLHTTADGEATSVGASAAFTPAEAGGSVDVTFTFDAREFAGQSVTMYESLFSSPAADYSSEWSSFFGGLGGTFDISALKSGWIVAVHEDITDEGQTIHFVEVETTLTAENGLHMYQLADDGMVTLTDVVDYTNLIPGNAYTISGTLHVQVVNEDGSITDGGAVLDGEGNELVSSYTFVADKADGQAVITFTFDASQLVGRTVVAFESVSRDGITFAVHADIKDESQSEHFIEIGTTLLSSDGLHLTQVPDGDNKTVTITDTVAYENLIPGLEYEITGILHVQGVTSTGTVYDNGTLKDADGNSVTNTVTFVPETADGTVDVTFTFDASDLMTKTLTAYEYLSVDGIVIATHEEIDDEDQAEHFAELSTTALSKDGLQEIQLREGEDTNVSFTDTVTYKNLIPGLEYTIIGTLHVQDTDIYGNIIDGGVVTDANGNAVTGYLAYAVVDDDPVADPLALEDAEDIGEPQAMDETDADEAEESEAEEPESNVLYGGHKVTGAVTFIPETPDGAVEMTFNFDAAGLYGKTTVIYEAISLNGVQFAAHEDITEEGQSIYFVDMGTTLETKDGLHITQSGEGVNVHIIDAVRYENLIPGKTYTVEGTLHIQNVDEDGNITDGGVAKDAEGNDITSSTTFTAETPDGYVNVEFLFDSSHLTGTTVVAFESMSRNGVQFAVHADIRDESQSMHLVSIGTTAVTKDGLHMMQIPEDGNEVITITDTLAYENIIPGVEYTVIGTLHVMGTDAEGNVGDGGVLKNENGNAVSAQATFTPDMVNGTVDVTFEVKASEITGKTIVVYETLYYGDIEIASHQDIEDEGQTIHFVDLGTTALTEAGLHEIQISDDNMTVTIIDRVAYENLIPGMEYALNGVLHIRGEDKNGNIVDAGAVIDADKHEVTGTLLQADKADADKADVEEADTAEDADVEDVTEEAEDTDTEAAEDAAEAEASDVVTGMTFVPTTSDGYVDMVFTFDASILTGRTTVVFEYLSVDGIVIATHEDIKDEGQTTHFVELGTTASTEDGLQEMQVPADKDATVTITDTVAYENLVPGTLYELTGTIHVQDVDDNGKIIDGGTLKDAEGKDVTSTVTFAPDSAEGTVNMTFTFNASELNGKTIVVFESMSRDGVEFAVHADITDEGQSIHFVDLKTTALTKDSQHQMQAPDEKDKTVTITDTVFYENLVPGREYTVTGTLHVQEVKWDGGKAVISDGGVLVNSSNNAIVSTKTFTAEKANGSVELEFTFDASALEGKTVVAFETMSRNGKDFAVHADITDESQSIHFVKIGTNAVTQDGTHTVQVPADKDITVKITDTVTYENLIPGLEYTMSGVLHVQSVSKTGKITDGGELKDAHGKPITAETTFVPASSSGTIDVVFELSTADMYDGTVVVFETLTHKKYVVAEHKDITDEGQSVKFLPPDKPNTPPPTTSTPPPSTSTKPNKPNDTVKTGQDMYLLVGIIGLVAMSGGGFFFFTKTAKGRKILKKLIGLFSRK